MIDVAITGSGTQADPWIVHDWSEFYEKNTNNTLSYIKFANVHVDSNETIVLSGTGTLFDPYIVSTYEELLLATGTTEVWQPKLIDKVSRLYKFSDIYCKWDAVPSTIDLSAPGFYPTGFSSTFSVPNNVDFNGWTLTNMLFTSSSNAITINRNYKSVVFKRAFITNMETQYNELFGLAMQECVVDVKWTPDSYGYSHIFTNYGTACGNISKCNITVDCKKSSYAGNNYAVDIVGTGSGGYALLYDTVLTFNANCGVLGQNSSYTHGVRLTRSILKGSTTATDSENSIIFDGNISGIVDFAVPNMSTFPLTGYNSSSICLYNKDKLTPRYSSEGWKGVTTSELMDPVYLQSLGFSIGVDT